jgi:hypothetical protein
VAWGRFLVSLKKRLLLLVGIPLTLFLVAGAANVTILSSAKADYAGVFLQPYYENLNAPVSGCTSPCLTVDTQGTEPNLTPRTLSVDSHGLGGNSPSPSTATVTTTDTNDVIVVTVTCNPGVTAMSVSGAGLTWNTRYSDGGAWVVGSRSGGEFWAYAPSALSSQTITVTYTGGSACNPLWIAINGANTASPFDANSGLPSLVNANSPTSCAVSTTNANDILFGVMMQGGTPSPGPGVPSGWTALDSNVNAAHWDAYDIVDSTQSSASESWTGTSGGNIAGFCDAVQGVASFTLSGGSSMYLWSPQFAAATSIPAGSLSLQLFADPPAPALDGSATGSWSSGSTFNIASFSTAKANDVVVLSIDTYTSGSSVTVSSITDSLGKITWQGSARSSFVTCSGTQEATHVEWYGIASTAVSSDTITVKLSSAPTAASGIALGVSGADTTTPFDPAAGLPKTASSACSATGAAPAAAAVSTVADNDFVFSLFGGYTSVTETAGNIGSPAATLVATAAGTGDSNAVEYVTTATSQSGISCSFGTAATYWGILCDALMPLRQAITVSYYTTNSAGAVQSTMASGASATVTGLNVPISVVSSAGTVPASGYVEVVITGPASIALTVYWGAPKPTLFEIAYTYRS